MNTIGTPMAIPELDLRPEPLGGIQLSEDMQQALSLLAGFWKNRRVLLKSSMAGILFVAEPQITDVIHITASSGDYLYHGDDIECTEVMIMGHPDNAGLVWAKPHLQADTDCSWPLAKKEVVKFTLSSLSQLHLRIVTNGDIAIIAYTL